MVLKRPSFSGLTRSYFPVSIANGHKIAQVYSYFKEPGPQIFEEMPLYLIAVPITQILMSRLSMLRRSSQKFQCLPNLLRRRTEPIPFL
jgi:hypothetical protein